MLTQAQQSSSPPIGTKRERDQRLLTTLTFLPIVIATIASLYASIWSMSHRLLMSWPQNPWESAIVADAWRFAHGQRVYERIPAGHATHLYGPLTSPTIGLVFKLSGTSSLLVGRVIVLTCALATCAILLGIFAPRRPLAWFIGVGLMFALHYRGRAYFVETRPDMIGALLATLAVIASYLAHARKQWWLGIPAMVLVVGAMLYKQTYACVAVVPLLALAMSWRETDRQDRARHILFALGPVGAVVLCVLMIKTLAPNVFFYMFQVPSMYEIGWETRAPFGFASLFMHSPLFVALFGWFLLDERRRASIEPRLRWLIAAIVVGGGAGMLAFAKRGGSYNSLLLGFIPMAAFCVAMIEPMLRRLTDRSTNTLARNLAGWAIGLFIAISTFGVPNSDLWNFDGAHGGPDYASVVKTVRDLKGNVICPDDPTILIRARGEVCRNLEAELDATDRPGKLPPGLYEDVANADWLIRVHGHYDDGDWWTPEMMTSLGFERLAPKEAGAGFRHMYSLWKRVAPAPAEALDPNRPKRRRGRPPT